MRASPQFSTKVMMSTEPPPPLNLNGHALFLDLDGTLVEIEARPHAVIASRELRDLLQRLQREMRGAIAIITGRTLGEVNRILHGAIDCIAGVHGFEVQRGPQITRDAAELEPLAEATHEIRALLQARSLPALVEDKRASLALHYRHSPEVGPQLLSLAREIAARHGLRVMQGKMVVELIAGARTKGNALTAFMQTAPFAGRTPVKLGDDLTDEDAFVAANSLGGFGVLVGDTRESAARYLLRGPEAVREWLAAPFGATP